MRVAVIFFGLARSVSHTIESIRRNIYAANADDGFSFCTFASLNLLRNLNNPRAGELNVALDPAETYLLNADFYLLAAQDDASIAAPLAAAQRQPDGYQDDWGASRNLLHQLVSLQRAWTACTSAPHGQFDYFLFLRPDLLYLDRLRLAKLVATFSGSGNIALPAWQRHGGFNDRFAFADVAAARHYAERLALVAQYCSLAPLHAERLLAYALDQGQCRVCALPVRAQRIRAHGVKVRETFAGLSRNLPRKPQRFALDSLLRPVFKRRLLL